MADKINMFDYLPSGFVVNVTRNALFLPLDRYPPHEFDRKINTLKTLYNLNSGIRYDILYEIKRHGLIIEPVSYNFLDGEVINAYIIPRVWRIDLINFIVDNDFGPVDPLNVNSPALTSYLCLIGGENSSCPGQPTYITIAGTIIPLILIYIYRNNLFSKSKTNIARLRNGKSITTKYFATDDTLRKLILPYLTHNEEIDFDEIEQVQLARLILKRMALYKNTPNEINAIKMYILRNAPNDEIQQFEQAMVQARNIKEQENDEAKRNYRKKWRGIPPNKRTDPPHIDMLTYDMNELLERVRESVGHDLSPVIYADATIWNEYNIVRDALKVYQKIHRM